MNLRSVLQFSIGPLGGAVLSLVTLPFVAWFFSVEDVGRLTMLQVVLGLSISLFSLAMHQAYVREYHEEEDKQALFKLSILPGLCVLIAFNIILWFMPQSISLLLFDIDSSLLSLLLLICVFSSFLINFLAHVVRMEERGLAFSATQIVPKAFLLIFIGLILLLNLKADFKILMLMNTLSITFSLLIFAWLTKCTWLGSITKPIKRPLLIKMLTFSLPLVAGGMAYWGLTTMDRFFLRSLVGFQELGVYALSVSLAGCVSVISNIFSNLWHPVLYKWVKEGVDKDKLLFVIENMVVFVCFIWTIVGIFSFVLLYFLPKEYIAIQYLIVACIAMPLFYMLSETTGVGIGVTRSSTYSMLASILAFIINGILNYILIPMYGASGAALATVAAFFVFFIIRTESSANLWWSFPRWKIYFLMILYMAATTVMLLSKATISYFFLIWVVLFAIVYLCYFEVICKTMLNVRSVLLDKFNLKIF